VYNNEPVLLIVGDGGAGKDSVAVLIRDLVGIPYLHSTSYTAAMMMWQEITDWRLNKLNDSSLSRFDWVPEETQSLKDFYLQRSDFRREWADWIREYNRQHENWGLYRQCCQEGNRLLTGIRKVSELEACQQRNLFDLILWVDRPGIPRDPTQEYGPERADFILRNDNLERTIVKINRIFTFCKKVRDSNLFPTIHLDHVNLSL
jgi:hypothetical protein